MKRGNFFFTSESVTEGHPDKLADQVSDAILDAIIEKDKYGRVACETLVGKGFVFVAGEITTSCYVDIPSIVRETVKNAGYNNPEYGFDYECGVMTAINEQSPDIALGVDKKGAGDQGIMVGFAINQTEQLMPLPIMLAHALVKRLSYVRKNKILSYLRPDGKSQVTVYYEDGKPKKITCIVLSSQHDEDVKYETLQEGLIEEVIKAVIPPNLIEKNTKILINPTGRFVIGGPVADTGLTGRKIMVDTYGGYVTCGGGCFSGKDATKVDRSAAYMLRYIAKNIVASGICEACEIQIAYAIGMQEPLALSVNTFGTSKIPDEKLKKIIEENFDFTPWGIIESLSLLRPIYKKTAVYGHFGREEEEFSWEMTDKKDIFKICQR